MTTTGPPGMSVDGLESNVSAVPARWLVTGGAGYIGSHVVAALLDSGRDVLVADDLSTGRRERLADGVPFVAADITEPDAVRALFEQRIDGVIHLAARTLADESVRRPREYYRVNVEGTRLVLDVALDAGVRRVVFTSSAAVYGRQPSGVVGETLVPDPLTPYGRSKLVGEWLVRDAAAVSELGAVSLRLFNVAGTGQPELGNGARTGLLPAVLDAVAADRAPAVFGADYDTPDGSCVRDYVHVADVAAAYLRAAEVLERGPRPVTTVNVGRGSGSSVLDIVAAAEKVTGRRIEARIEGRRVGDAPYVVAAIDRITEELGWAPSRATREMVAGEWQLRQRVSS